MTESKDTEEQVQQALRIAIVGTRHATDAHYASFADRLVDALMVFANDSALNESAHEGLGGITHLVSGGAPGIDTLAERFAATPKHGQGAEMVVFPADWGRYGRAAGPLRNKQIHEAADACVAFPDENSRGTLNTISLFKESSKPFIIIPFETLEVSA